MSKQFVQDEQRLYHYTTADGIKGILEQGALWATHVEYSDDPGELKHFVKVCVDEVKTIDAEPGTPLLLMLESCRHLLGAIAKMKLEFYAASFSRGRDLLSQWRAYADGGKGFAIAFDNMPSLASRLGHRNTYLVRIDYCKENQQKRARELILAGIDQLKISVGESVDIKKRLTGMLVPPSIPEAKIAAEVGAQLAASMVIEAPSLKAKGFEEEDEVRQLCTFQGDLPSSVSRKVRVRSGRLVPYIELPLRASTEEEMPIREIVVGPKLEFAKTKRALEHLLWSSDAYKSGDKLPCIRQSDTSLT